MFLDSFKNKCLLPSLNLAHISLIRKKNKPSDEYGSYRPVSLINVLTNGMRSSPFPLGRGTRQGFLLSPLLFALTSEELAERIRTCNNIHNITSGKTTHKIALYMDDILLFLTDPKVSVPAILTIVNSIGSISGYKVNYTKSDAMPLGNYGSTTSDINFPLRWATSGFVYLGMKIPVPDVGDLERLLERIFYLQSEQFMIYPLQMIPLWI